ncbi:MAG TPA: IclR family transcriptional regulator [Burkholderiaceae bacterium]|nr:IclR family transcriptional regulator [Burkholderiaceae bacterium]
MENENNTDRMRDGDADGLLDVLLAFRPGDDEVSAAEMAQRVDLSGTTLQRLFEILERKRFLASYGEPRRLRLGPAVARLAQMWSAAFSVAGMAQPMMGRLWEATGETVALFVPEGVFRVCVAELESPQPLSFKRGTGYRERLVIGASGRAILAHTPGIEEELPRYAAGLDIDIEKYHAQFDQIRRQGWASSKDELIHGAVAVAAPFFDASGRVAGSIGVFGPSVRLPQTQAEKIGTLLAREGAEISRAFCRTGRRSG